jgi:hypothetical protein
VWLRGDTSRWDVHYAFFARSAEQLEAIAGEDAVHVFKPVDAITL